VVAPSTELGYEISRGNPPVVAPSTELGTGANPLQVNHTFIHNTFAFFRAGTGAPPLHTTDFRPFIVFGEGIEDRNRVSAFRKKKFRKSLDSNIAI